MKGVVYDNGTGAMFVCHFDARVHRVIGNGLAYLVIGVPGLTGIETGFLDLHLRLRFATSDG